MIRRLLVLSSWTFDVCLFVHMPCARFGLRVRSFVEVAHVAVHGARRGCPATRGKARPGRPSKAAFTRVAPGICDVTRRITGENAIVLSIEDIASVRRGSSGQSVGAMPDRQEPGMKKLPYCRRPLCVAVFLSLPLLAVSLTGLASEEDGNLKAEAAGERASFAQAFAR
jgi:hypothetical protein